MIFLCMTAALLVTVLAGSVENGPYGIDGEFVVLADMIFEGLDLFAMQVKELAALLALEVVAAAFVMAVLSDILKASGSLIIDSVFLDDAFSYQSFESSVDSGLTDLKALGFEIIADVGSRKVFTFGCFEILQEHFFLFCLIGHLRAFPLNLGIVPNYSTAVGYVKQKRV